MPPNAEDRLVCTILAAQVAALRDRIDTGATVELLWQASDVLSKMSGLVLELATLQAGANPELDDRCAAAAAAEVEISRSIEDLAFLQAQHQDFGRQTADCVVNALGRLASADPAGATRLSVDDLAALYVCEEQRQVHDVVARQYAAETPPDQIFAPGSGDPEVFGLTTAAAEDAESSIQLLGAAIIDQVDTSVTAVLSENHQMREMASEMATASAQAKDQFKNAMSRSDEAEGGIEQLNAFSSELTGSIQVIGSEVQRSIAIVKEATDQANATRDCVQTMAALSRGVSEVVRMIDDIARQSKMLALNATIEAARAGDAGRGFVVVAREMNQLSSQTAEATQTIGSKIDGMNDMVTRSVASLQALVGTIASVDTASASIGRAIAEQDNLVERVSTSLESMRGGVFALSREIREAAQIAANSGMLSEMVLETANSVDGLVSGLKGKLEEMGRGSLRPDDSGTSSIYVKAA